MDTPAVSQFNLVEKNVIRFFPSLVLLGSTIIYNERCEVTFVGIPAIAETQAAMNKIVNEYYLEEIDSLLEEVAAEKGFV